MSDRGDYRSLYVSFWDDEDVHGMSDVAYRVLTTLRGTLPASGIGIVYASQLAERCGKTTADIEAAMVELERAKPGKRHGWIVRDDRRGGSKYVVWIVNGLRFEGSLSGKNSKHRTFVRDRHLAPLGMQSPIVRAFLDYYAEWFDVPRETTNEDSGNPIPEHQDRVSQHSISPIQSNPNQPEPTQPGIDDDPVPTPVAIVRAINDARSERWGEPLAMANPVTMGAATMLATSLAEKGVPMSVARESVYRQCRGSKDAKPISSANYFEPGILQDWDAEQERRRMTTGRKPERPPPSGAVVRPLRRAVSGGTPTPVSDPNEKIRW